MKAAFLLRTGECVAVRALRSSDAEALRRAFASLSLESRARRFLMPVRDLPEGVWQRLLDVEGVNHIALVAVRCGEIVGVARAIRSYPGADDADLSLVIADELQGLGLGRHLLSMLIAQVRARGIRRLTAQSLATNTAVHKLLAHIGGRRVSDDGTVHHFVIHIGGNDGHALST